MKSHPRQLFKPISYPVSLFKFKGNCEIKLRTEKGGLSLLDSFSKTAQRKVDQSTIALLRSVEEVHQKSYRRVRIDARLSMSGNQRKLTYESSAVL